MAMKEGASAPINPANLWGRPDPRAARTKEETVSRKIDEENPEDVDIDVDAALDEADVEDEESAYTEAEAEEETGDDDGDDDFDPEEGDEEDADGDADDELETDTTASAEDDVEDDDDTPAANNKSAATSRKRDMSAKKTSLSDHIRSEIASRQEAGDSLRGKDIVAALASRRIKVSPAQVSQILKKEGLGGQPRAGRKPKAAPAGADGERSRTALKTKRNEPKKASTPARVAPKAARPAGNGFHVPMDQLQAAETFVKACGGSFESATRILTAAEQLSQSFGG